MVMVQYNLYPIVSYNNHLGRPLYKFGRKKLKLGELGSLYVAKLPGTCAIFGLAYATTQNFWGSLIAATINEIITPRVVYQVHRENKIMRGNDLEAKISLFV